MKPTIFASPGSKLLWLILPAIFSLISCTEKTEFTRGIGVYPGNPTEELSTGWRYTVSGSMDGLDWEELFVERGSGLPGRDRPQRFRRPPADTTAPRFDFFANFMGLRDPNEPQPSFGFNFGPRSPRVSIASWDENTGSLLINSTVTFNRGGNTTEMLSSEEWSLGVDAKVLSIRQQSTGFRGNKIDITLIYEKQ